MDIELELDKLMLSDVKMGEVIGSGNFGEVRKGTWDGTPVAVRGVWDVNLTDRVIVERPTEESGPPRAAKV